MQKASCLALALTRPVAAMPAARLKSAGSFPVERGCVWREGAGTLWEMPETLLRSLLKISSFCAVLSAPHTL